MKIILTGTTGMIGSEVLKQCLSHSSITSIIVLSRRPLPSSAPQSGKLKVIILEDFTSYPTSILHELSGAQACIWALGGIPSKFPDLETARKVNIDFPIAAAKAFISALSPQLLGDRKFRFVYCSGRAVERDMEKSLWVFKDGRQIKGEIEMKLEKLQEENNGVFRVFLPRPGSVIPANSLAMKIVGVLTGPIYPALKVEELAAAMTELAIIGGKKPVILHDELQERGKELLHGV